MYVVFSRYVGRKYCSATDAFRAKAPRKRAQLRSGQGQVWGHTPEQRVAASTLRRSSFGLRLAIAQADARPAMPASFR